MKKPPTKKMLRDAALRVLAFNASKRGQLLHWLYTDSVLASAARRGSIAAPMPTDDRARYS